MCWQKWNIIFTVVFSLAHNDLKLKSQCCRYLRINSFIQVVIHKAMLHRHVFLQWPRMDKSKLAVEDGLKTIQNINTEYNSTRIDLTELTLC